MTEDATTCKKCGHAERVHIGKPVFCTEFQCHCPGFEAAEDATTPPTPRTVAELLAQTTGPAPFGLSGVLQASTRQAEDATTPPTTYKVIKWCDENGEGVMVSPNPAAGTILIDKADYDALAARHEEALSLVESRVAELQAITEMTRQRAEKAEAERDALAARLEQFTKPAGIVDQWRNEAETNRQAWIRASDERDALVAERDHLVAVLREVAHHADDECGFMVLVRAVLEKAGSA